MSVSDSQYTINCSSYEQRRWTARLLLKTVDCRLENEVYLKTLTQLYYVRNDRFPKRKSYLKHIVRIRTWRHCNSVLVLFALGFHRSIAQPILRLVVVYISTRPSISRSKHWLVFTCIRRNEIVLEFHVAEVVLLNTNVFLFS